jgi:hypothetical protein
MSICTSGFIPLNAPAHFSASGCTVVEPATLICSPASSDPAGAEVGSGADSVGASSTGASVGVDWQPTTVASNAKNSSPVRANENLPFLRMFISPFFLLF